MTRFKPKGAKIERITIPLPIFQHHNDLQLYIDLFFVNGYPLLATRRNKVNFITSEPCISRTTSHATKAIDTLLDLYEERVSNITVIHGDN